MNITFALIIAIIIFALSYSLLNYFYCSGVSNTVNKLIIKIENFPEEKFPDDLWKD
jgi:hypothetical protein